MAQRQSRSQVCEPMNPAPPVTRIFISVLWRSRAPGGFAGSDAVHVAAMAQNTLAEISSALIREWRTYWARECMMA